MIIDTFCHIYPQDFLTALAKAKSPLPHATFTAQIKQGWENFVDPELRLRHMDCHGVDLQVLSLATPAFESASPKEQIELARIANEGIAETVTRYPKRFLGVATLPMLSIDEALEEMDYAIEKLGLKGIQLFSNIGGKPLDVPELMPFYEKVVRADVPLLLHPTWWSYTDWIMEYGLWNIFGWPFDTSLAMGRIVFGGILEGFPTLKIITHHLGAMTPYFVERIRGFYDQGEQYPNLSTCAKITKPPLDYFKLFYGDTAVYGWKPALLCGLAFFGADHVTFATDYPFGPEAGERYISSTIKSIHELEISAEERETVFSGNAKRLFKI
jgi:aminocarboxymuconate-semialdehyde decarboxylase